MDQARSKTPRWWKRMAAAATSLNQQAQGWCRPWPCSAGCRRCFGLPVPLCAVHRHLWRVLRHHAQTAGQAPAPPSWRAPTCQVTANYRPKAPAIAPAHEEKSLLPATTIGKPSDHAGLLSRPLWVPLAGLAGVGLHGLAYGRLWAALRAPPLMVGTNIWAGVRAAWHVTWVTTMVPLRLVELGSTTQVMDALRTGRLDVAGVTLDEALTLAHEGVPISVIWSANISAERMSSSPPTLAQVSDLRGPMWGGANSGGCLHVARRLAAAAV